MTSLGRPTCDYCDQPGTAMVGESNETIVCRNHLPARLTPDPDPHAADWLTALAARAWDEGYDAAAWRSFRRTGISIGRADEADPPNPYRADEIERAGRAGGGS